MTRGREVGRRGESADRDGFMFEGVVAQGGEEGGAVSRRAWWVVWVWAGDAGGRWEVADCLSLSW